MLNKTLFAAILVAVAVSVHAQTKAPTVKEQAILAKKNLVKEFLDPESAKFRGLIGYGMKHPDGQVQLIALCGEVNGKNSFGAYTGFKRFYSIGGMMSKIETEESPVAAYDTTCKGDVVFQEK